MNFKFNAKNISHFPSKSYYSLKPSLLSFSSLFSASKPISQVCQQDWTRLTLQQTTVHNQQSQNCLFAYKTGRLSEGKEHHTIYPYINPGGLTYLTISHKVYNNKLTSIEETEFTYHLSKVFANIFKSTNRFKIDG